MSSNSSSKQQELKHIATIVRALVTSRKPPCYLRDILREYPEVESKQLPYKNLGYRTAQELLEDSGEFIFNGHHGTGDVIITARHSSKTAHITSLVRGQKSAKPTRFSPVKAVRKPLRMPATRSNGSGFGFGDRNNNNSSNYNSRNNYHHQPSYQQQPMQRSTQQRSMGSQSQQPKDLREMLNSKKNQKLPMQSQNQSQSGYQAKQMGPRAILGASKPTNNSKESQNQPDVIKRTISKTQSTQQNHAQNITSKLTVASQPEKQQLTPAIVKRPQERLIVKQNNQQQAQALTPPPKPTVQQPTSPPINNAAPLNNLVARLKLQPQPQPIAQPQSTNILENTAKQAEANLSSSGLQNRLNRVYRAPEYTNQPSAYNQFVPKIDAVAALVQYCRTKNFPAPRFSCIKGKFSRGTFSSSVHVNDTIFSTYPSEYESEYMAKEACANRALEKLKMQEKKRPLPPCSFTDTELLDKLYTELLDHPHGIFAKNLPEWFGQTFQQSLPDNWWALIQTSSLFTTETGLSKVIIFANKDADKDVPPLGACDKTKTIQIDPIRLPWSEDHWSIFITHCTSTVEIWGRLFSDDHSARFDALMNDIEIYMGNRKERPVSIAGNNIYLVSLNDCWHRVRVEKLDKSKGSVLCFFIDFGDADWLPVDQLYICETSFLRLAAQAVPFSMYGLEDFEGTPYARKCLDELLPTKSVVGKIFTKESEFYDTNSKFHGKIQAVFFDTSSQEDVNLNQQLSTMICEETLAPEIKPKTVTNVLVTHVNDNGEIFLQVSGPELKYIQQLLLQTVEFRLKRDQHKVTFEDLKRSNMFLICVDDDDGEVTWCRGTLAETNISADSNKYQMFLVDQGLTKTVDIAKIFLLESLSLALSKFPALAIKVRLHNIPDINKNIVGRIRGLLPKECEALTKLVVPGTVPLVTIYTRFDGKLCTINDAITITCELEGSSDMSSDVASNGAEDTHAAAKFTLDFSKNAVYTSSSASSLASPSTPTGNSFDITRGLTLTTVPGSPQKASDLPKLSNYEAIPVIGQYFDVRVTMSANPSNFTIQPYNDYPNLRALMKELQEFCESNDEFIPTDMVEIGEAYAAKNPDGFFHRVQAVKKYGDMIHVSFCDFGDIATVDSSQLKTLPLKFRQLPKMAIQAKLNGIKALNGDWTLDDCLFFRQLTVGKTFVSVIRNITCDKANAVPTQMLELELIDVSSDEDVLIHELLLNEKRAIQEN